MSTERFGSPIYLMHRGDLHAMLVSAVRQHKPDAIHLCARCSDFEQDKSSVRLHLEDGAHATGDILIGADGLHSTIRRRLFGPAEPKFTGILAWRGLAAIERLPEHLRRPIATQWLGPRGHVTCYPVRRGSLLNMVGQVERDDVGGSIKPGYTPDHTTNACETSSAGISDLLSIIADSVDQFYKVGAVSARAASKMVQSAACLSSWRRLPRDAAVPGARRQHGHRGWLRSGTVH